LLDDINSLRTWLQETEEQGRGIFNRLESKASTSFGKSPEGVDKAGLRGDNHGL
jgi:hypothetical protein